MAAPFRQPASLERPRAALELLLVEDEANIRDLVRLHLEAEGNTCTAIGNGHEALTVLHERRFDALILDVMLPGLGGLALCREIREHALDPTVPILLLTARSEESDKLAGFESGADDYLTKPFSMRELSARLTALTRRTRGQIARPSLTVTLPRSGLTLDALKRTMTVRGHDVPVTAHEFKLLYLIVSQPGVVFTRERLLAEVWEDAVYVTDRSVDTLVHRLRGKIEYDPARPSLIQTVWGEGYKFVDA
jgi:DNA-binding response OmpR family regulator